MAKSDQTEDIKFRRVLGSLLRTPHKPHKPREESNVGKRKARKTEKRKDAKRV